MEKKVQDMINGYVNAWNHACEKDFKDAFSKVWREDSKCTDPTFEAVGADELVNIALMSVEKFPGRGFEVLTIPEYHHHVGRYNWRVTFTDGTYKDGLDCFEFDENFFITRIITFL